MEQDNTKIEDLYQQGHSAPTISALTEVPVHRVRQVLKAKGYVLTGGVRTSLDQRWSEIEPLLSSGDTFLEVSRQTGVPYQTLLRWARQKGYDTSSRAGYSPDIQARAVALARSGVTGTEISDQIGIPVATIYRWMQRHGIMMSIPGGSKPLKRQRLWSFVLSHHEEGKSVNEIVALLPERVHETTVAHWLREAGEQPVYTESSSDKSPHLSRTADPEIRERALLLYLEGQVATKVDLALGLGHGQTKAWAIEAGVLEEGGKFKKRAERRIRAADLFASGMSTDKIAKAIGVDYYSAKAILSEVGCISVGNTDARTRQPMMAQSGQACPCGEYTGHPSKVYCSPAHVLKYAAKRQSNPDNWEMRTCGNITCPLPDRQFKCRKTSDRLYCSNTCSNNYRATAARDPHYDSNYERLFEGLCHFVKIPYRVYDRVMDGEVTYAYEGREHRYAPDHIVKIAGEWLPVETKGRVRPDDPIKWAAYRAQRGMLLVLNDVGLRTLLTAGGHLEETLLDLATAQTIPADPLEGH